MRKMRNNTRGFTLTEVMFVAVISGFIVAAVMSAWIFTHRAWSGDRTKTSMRIELLTAVETMKRDIRLSSGDYMTFYPAGAASYTAFMMPQATRDADGFFVRDVDRKIVWDKTVFYHILDIEGTSKLVRTVINSWDDTLDEEGRYLLLEDAVFEEVDWDSRDILITEYLDNFSIGPLPREVDFYADSEDPVRENNVVFGTVNVTPGTHTIRFVVSGKNLDSSGYHFGLDNIRLDPSGSYREAEYYMSDYAPEGMFSDGGGTLVRVYDTVFRNNNYLEYQAADVDDYIEFTDDYDLWRESIFESSSFSNMSFDGEEMRAKIVVPQDYDSGGSPDEYGVDTAWESFNEVGAAMEEPVDAVSSGNPAVFRTLITKNKIDPSGTEADPVRGDMIRLKLRSSSSAPLKVDRAYITRRDMSVGAELYDGIVNDVPVSGESPYLYHMHQQLFFKDLNDGNLNGDSVEILPEAWIAAGGYLWSEWISFPLTISDSGGADADYFLTLCASDADICMWAGSSTHTYAVYFNECVIDDITDRVGAVGHGLADGDAIVFSAGTAPEPVTLYASPQEVSGTPVWSSLEDSAVFYHVVNSTVDDFQVSAISGGPAVNFTTSGADVLFSSLEIDPETKIYIIAEIDAWRNTGTVESKIFDTDVVSPAYNEIKWSEENPSGASVILKARSSNNYAMTGALAWDDISDIAANPSALSIGGGRYLQFFSRITVTPFWEWSGGTQTYEDYVTEQAALSPHDFPSNGGEYIVSAVNDAWIDDVEVDWPGDSRICVIKADIAKKDNYGKVFVEFDGKPLSWGYNVSVGVSAEHDGKVFSEEKIFGLEAINTGR